MARDKCAYCPPYTGIRLSPKRDVCNYCETKLSDGDTTGMICICMFSKPFKTDSIYPDDSTSEERMTVWTELARIKREYLQSHTQKLFLSVEKTLGAMCTRAVDNWDLWTGLFYFDAGAWEATASDRIDAFRDKTEQLCRYKRDTAQLVRARLSQSYHHAYAKRESSNGGSGDTRKDWDSWDNLNHLLTYFDIQPIEVPVLEGGYRMSYHPVIALALITDQQIPLTVVC